jgi:hypothetical protein
MMRLGVVERGHRLPQKLILGLIRVATGMKPPSVVKTILYRPELFGKPFSALLQKVMRIGPSEWPVAELELFASFTSRLNQCLF